MKGLLWMAPKASKLACAALLVCNCAVIGQPRSAPLPPPALPVPAYIEEIDRWAAELAKANDHPENIPALRRELPSSWQVAADGQVVAVSTAWLDSGLEAAERYPKLAASSIGRLLARLQAIRREAQALAAEPSGPDSTAPEKLREILARPEFGSVRGPNWLDRMAERIRKWLDDWIDRLTSRLSGHERIAKFLTFLPWAILICAAGFLLAWMVGRLVRRPTTQRLNLPGPVPTPVQSWQRMVEAARTAASAQEYREAIRLAYWAAIVRLGNLKLWVVDPTRTHREYLRAVRSDQVEHEPLALLTRAFEMAWYAARSPSASDFQNVMTQLQRLGCA